MNHTFLRWFFFCLALSKPIEQDSRSKKKQEKRKYVKKRRMSLSSYIEASQTCCKIAASKEPGAYSLNQRELRRALPEKRIHASTINSRIRPNNVSSFVPP